MAKRYRIIEFVYMVDEDEPEEVLNDTMDAVARVICPHEDADHNCPLVVASARTLTGEEFDRETDRDLLLLVADMESVLRDSDLDLGGAALQILDMIAGTDQDES